MTNYLRVSLTDRCNLKCIYCSSKDFFPLQSSEILTLEEIEKIINISADIGITKIRLTGGEPLLRKGLTQLIKKIKEIKKIKKIALTTNGILLSDFAEDLKDAGLQFLNISVDTLSENKFKKITGFYKLKNVIDGIKKAKEVGFKNIKINTVVMRGFNDDELIKFLEFAKELDVILRFIEYMPINGDINWAKKFISKDEILEKIKESIKKIEPEDFKEVAKYYKLKNEKYLGIISPVSCSLCEECNRLRLTASGFLKPCLARQEEIDIKTPLRNNASDDEIKKLFLSAIKLKSKSKINFKNIININMQKIGG